MRRGLAAGSAWRCWVAEADATLVGTVWLQLLDKLPNPVAEPERHGYVSSLYVRHAFRGAGVGSALLETCLRACEKAGVDAVLLWPTPESRNLYLRHGFAAREDLLERRL
jgi:GNAT superfamily N-acetyltransferase